MDKINKATIVTLKPQEWKKFRVLRLEALKRETHAFVETFEEASKHPDSKWKNDLRAAQKAVNHWLYFAEEKGELIGMVGAKRDEPLRKRHLVRIYGLYVTKKARGKGVSGQLMSTLMKALQKDSTIKKMRIVVVGHQENAIKNYKSHGFETVGILKKNLHCGKVFEDELLMEKLLF